MLILLCQMIFQRDCQLVRARGALKSATDSAKTLDCLLGAHANHQGGNTLRVSRAAAVESNGLNDPVRKLYVDFSRAYASGLITELIHASFLS